MHSYRRHAVCHSFVFLLTDEVGRQCDRLAYVSTDFFSLTLLFGDIYYVIRKTARIWHCELVPLHRLFSSSSKRNSLQHFFLIFARLSRLSEGEKGNKNLWICWTCICYSLPRVTYFLSLAGVHSFWRCTYIYTVWEKWKQVGILHLR